MSFYFSLSLSHAHTRIQFALYQGAFLQVSCCLNIKVQREAALSPAKTFFFNVHMAKVMEKKTGSGHKLVTMYSFVYTRESERTWMSAAWAC